MHRRPEAELLSLDTEKAVMAEHREGNQNIPVVATDRPQQR